MGYPAYRIASEVSPTFVFTYENKFFCLGAHHQHLDELTSIAVTKTYCFAYWKDGSSSGGNATSIKGDRGIQGKRTGGVGPIGPHGPKSDIGPPGGAGVKGDRGEVGPKGEQGVRGLACEIGPRGDKGERGSAGEIGPKGGNGDPGSQGAAGKIGLKGDKGDRGALAVEIDIVSELCKHLPIAIVEQYRLGAYIRYSIDSMKDIELHDAARVKTIIDKGGR